MGLGKISMSKMPAAQACGPECGAPASYMKLSVAEHTHNPSPGMAGTQ